MRYTADTYAWSRAKVKEDGTIEVSTWNEGELAPGFQAIMRHLLGNRRSAAYFKRADPSHAPGKRSGKNPRVVWPCEWGACRSLSYSPEIERLLRKRGVHCVRQDRKLLVDKKAYEDTIRRAVRSDRVNEMLQELMAKGG